ncbi:glycolipid transfer protein domain-containing protein 2 [Trichosurus vulpecula]|uniref:glycolipid transfer protein domain-containing protein 2 n=1 Tax=Trichosurus vulpecula TaxID=9337 RepID=UPI00186AF0FB|nr:glycolipid transfer protein domain-containing protein 2 [Trichosurus vulpecula]
MQLKLLPPDSKVWAPRHWLSCALPGTIFIFMWLFYLVGEKVDPGLKSGELRCLGPEQLPGQVIRPFRESLTSEGDLQLPQFLDGWRKLVTLLEPLGPLFAFATQEASAKLSILESYSRGPHWTHYHTISAMADWERDPSKLHSGLYTLVLLHRALHWAQLCLGGITRVQNEDIGALCGAAYRSVLGPHHRWLIRQAANLAFLAFPSRSQLLVLVCPGSSDQEAQEALSQVADVLEAVYNRTQRLLAERGMLTGVTLKPTRGR